MLETHQTHHVKLFNPISVIYIRDYLISPPERGAMEKYISESHYRRHCTSIFSSAGGGFTFVEKKDKSLRQCIDYRGLNDVMVKDHYALPLMSPASELLHGACIFSKLDLSNTYHLLRIRRGLPVIPTPHCSDVSMFRNISY